MIAQLIGGLQGFELVIEGLEDPLLEDVSEVGLDFAEDETDARRPDIKDGCFGLELFT